MESYNTNSSQREQLQESLDYHRALRAFDNYIKSLGWMQFHPRTFSLKHHKAFGLSKEQFHELMDAYKVPDCERYGERAMNVFVPVTEEGGRIKKSIFLFSASRAKKYDVLVAEVSSSIGFNRKG